MRFVRVSTVLWVGWLAMAACGPRGDAEEMDPANVRGLLTAETQRVAGQLESALRFLEEDGLAHRAVEFMGAYEEVCAEPTDREGNQTGSDPEGETCEWVIDTDLGLYAEEFGAFLEEHVLVEANVSSRGSDSLVYLLDGRAVCLEDGDAGGPGADAGPGAGDAGSAGSGDVAPSEEERECIEAVDRAQWRLRITSPAEDALDVEVYVGPQKWRAVTLKVRPAWLTVRVDLAKTRSALRFVEETYAQVEGRTLPEDAYVYKLPEQLSGIVEVGLDVREARRAAFDVSLRQVDVAGQGFSVALPTNTPIFSASVDGKAATVSTSVSLPAFTASFPATLSVQDEESGESVDREVDVKAHTAGAEMQVLANQKTGLLTVERLALGHGKKHWLEFDGQRVMEFSAGALRSGEIDGRVRMPDAETMRFSTRGGVLFNTLLQFEGLEEKLNPDRWMLDGQLKGKATAGAEAVYDGGYLRMEKGQVSFADDRAGVQRSVKAGQCFDPEAPPAESIDYYHPIQDVAGRDSCEAGDSKEE